MVRLVSEMTQCECVEWDVKLLLPPFTGYRIYVTAVCLHVVLLLCLHYSESAPP